MKLAKAIIPSNAFLDMWKNLGEDFEWTRIRYGACQEGAKAILLTMG